MYNNKNNRGTHGDSSLILDGVPSLSEKPLPLGMGSVTISPPCINIWDGEDKNRRGKFGCGNTE